MELILKGTKHQSDEPKKPNLKSDSYNDWQNLYTAQSGEVKHEVSSWLMDVELRVNRWESTAMALFPLCSSENAWWIPANQAYYCRKTQYVNQATRDVVLPRYFFTLILTRQKTDHDIVFCSISAKSRRGINILYYRFLIEFTIKVL